MTDRQPDELEDARDALLLDDQQDPTDDAVFKLLDEDPDVRSAVAAEIKARLMGGQQQAAPERPDPTAEFESRLNQVNQEIEQLEAYFERFYKLPEAERVGENSYQNFQIKQDRVRKLEREARTLERQEQRLVQNLNQSTAWINQWIAEAQARDPYVKQYASDIQRLAQTLDAQTLADRTRLRNALHHYVEPNAYKEYNLRQRRNRQDPRRDPRRDTAGSGAYDDGAEPPARPKQDKYADASPAEREFLRGVGLIKDQHNDPHDGIIPTGDGAFVIPVRRGRKNEGSGTGN